MGDWQEAEEAGACEERLREPGLLGLLRRFNCLVKGTEKMVLDFLEIVWQWDENQQMSSGRMGNFY